MTYSIAARYSTSVEPECGSARRSPAIRPAARLAFAIAVCVLALPPTARWNEQAQLFAGDPSSGDGFGTAVAIYGNTLVTSSSGDDTPAGDLAGSAYVFARSDGVWSQQAHLYASDAEASDQFGTAVAIFGGRIVVAARSDTTGAGSYAGSAYPFVRSGTTWIADGHLFADDASAYDSFGRSVGISGDTIVVGASLDDIGALNEAGSAYVFVRGSVSWSQQDHLFASDAGAEDRFGNKVAIHGDTIVVGAQYWDGPSANGTGCAYVFTRSAGNWSQQARLVADDFEAGDEFGCAVAISGELIVVGSCQDNTVAGSDPGSAYVFVRSGGAWTQQGHLFADDARPNDHFGASVAISGKTVVVGAFADDTAAGDSAGSVYVFTRIAGVWIQQAHIFASHPAAGDEFGGAVAVYGDTAVMGVPEDATAAGNHAGSTYVYTKSFLDTFVGEPPAWLPARRRSSK